jgi:hypothetical protein
MAADNHDISLHDKVKRQILLACDSLGFQAKEEYRGADWRADVLASANGMKYAFEVQMSPQSLNRTLERQAKYKRDGVIGCWLFEKEPARQRAEREDLPLFKVISDGEHTYVSLKGRKTLPIDVFISDYLQGRMKFCQTLNVLPTIEVAFIEMDCWKCGTKNHIYYITPFKTPCNIMIRYNEQAMWESGKLVFRPEVMNRVAEYAHSEQGHHLNIGGIKERFSKMVNKSYMSFGCSKCDSIFGDWFVQEAIMETWYGQGIVDKFSFNVDFDLNLQMDIPHWCHPGEHDFCE